MYKIFLRITALILINLFAFLILWIILWEIFWNKKVFLIWCVIFSIIPLIIIMVFQIKKINIELNNIPNLEKNDWNTKWKNN